MISRLCGSSNFDYEEPLELTDLLMADPNAYANHPAWDHHGYMYFRDGQFHEDLWKHNVYRKTVSGATLREVFVSVNQQFGYD